MEAKRDRRGGLTTQNVGDWRFGRALLLEGEKVDAEQPSGDGESALAPSGRLLRRRLVVLSALSRRGACGLGGNRHLSARAETLRRRRGARQSCCCGGGGGSGRARA